MQVLSVPLRALLFCFEFIFGNGSRIKSCLTPFFVLFSVFAGYVHACAGGAVVTFFKPASYAQEYYIAHNRTLEEYIQSHYTNAQLKNGSQKIIWRLSDTFDRPRNQRVLIHIPKEQVPRDVHIEVSLHVQVEFTTCEARHKQAGWYTGFEPRNEKFNCYKTTAYKKLWSGTPRRSPRKPDILWAGDFDKPVLVELNSKFIVILVETNAATNEKSYFIDTYVQKPSKCGPEGQNIYVADNNARKDLNYQTYKIWGESHLKYFKMPHTFEDYLEFIENKRFGEMSW